VCVCVSVSGRVGGDCVYVLESVHVCCGTVCDCVNEGVNVCECMCVSV
jgi:hypothetical protein